MNKLISFFAILMFYNSGAFAQWLTLGTDIYNTNGGNVGIGTGTIAPAGKLHVGDGSLSGVILDNRLTTLTPKIAAQLVWAESGTYLAGDLLIAPRTSVAAGSVRFFTGTTPAERLTISGTGNIGINVAAPSEKLHIQNGNLLISSTGGLGTLMGSLRFSSSGWPSAYAGVAGQLNNAGADQVDLLFYTAYGSASEKMRIMSNSGFVGIGTSTPAVKLDIAGPNDQTVNLQTTGRARVKGTTPGIWFNDLTTDKAELGTMGSGNPNQALGIYTNGGGWNSFNVMTNGSVSVGGQTTNANAKLDVTGNIYCNSKMYIGIADAYTASRIANYSLAVNGTAIFNKAKVMLYGTPWPDFVFEEKYGLLPLNKLEEYIKKNKHLPEVPSAAEVKKEGIDLGDTQKLLLQKVEELTLYIIEQNKQLVDQNKQIQDQNKRLTEQQEQINQLIQQSKK